MWLAGAGSGQPGHTSSSPVPAPALGARPVPCSRPSTSLFLSLGEGGIALSADVDSALLAVPVRPQPTILFFLESGKHTDIDKDNNPTRHFPGSVSVPSQLFFGLSSPGLLSF